MSNNEQKIKGEQLSLLKFCMEVILSVDDPLQSMIDRSFKMSKILEYVESEDNLEIGNLIAEFPDFYEKMDPVILDQIEKDIIFKRYTMKLKGSLEMSRTIVKILKNLELFTQLTL